MVVKPLDFVPGAAAASSQPAVKCRGREYLRIIYGPDYTRPSNLERLRAARPRPQAVARPARVRPGRRGAGAVRPPRAAAPGPRVRLRRARPGERAGRPAALTAVDTGHRSGRCLLPGHGDLGGDVRTRTMVVLLALAALAAAIPASALGVVRFDREWKVTGFGGREAAVATTGPGRSSTWRTPSRARRGAVLVYDRDGKQLRTLEKLTGVDIERPAGVAVELGREPPGLRGRPQPHPGAHARGVPCGPCRRPGRRRSTTWRRASPWMPPTTFTSPTPVRAGSASSPRRGASCARSRWAAGSSPTSRWTRRATCTR